MDWELALAIGIIVGAVVNTIGTYRYNIKQADEIERLREALRWIERHPVEESKQWEVAVKEMKRLARSALQQKDVSQMTRMHDSYAQMSVDKGKP